MADNQKTIESYVGASKGEAKPPPIEVQKALTEEEEETILLDEVCRLKAIKQCEISKKTNFVIPEQMVNRRVKVKYMDEGTTCIVNGVLEEGDGSSIVVDGVVIGLGRNFISCILQEDRDNE